MGGQARSKTPNADMERSAYGPDCTRSPAYLNKVTYAGVPRTLGGVALRSSTARHFVTLQPMVLQDFRFGAEPDGGESPRRMGRSLSGTVVAPRRGRLAPTRSFVSWAPCALLPPRGRAMKLHLPDVPPLRPSHSAVPCALLPLLLFVSVRSCFSIRDVSISLCLSVSKVKQADVSPSPCLLPLF